MKPKRFLKPLLIFLLIVLPVLYFAFTMLLFNPFEGEHRPFHDAVPQEVDFFCAKCRLADDFSKFPEPKFYESLAATREWSVFVSSPSYAPIEQALGGRSLADLFDEIRGQLSEVPIDLVENVCGREMAVAGRQRAGGDLAWALFSRITFKVKLAYEAFRYSLVRMLTSVPVEEFEDQGSYLRMKLEGMDNLYLYRDRDMLVVSNDERFIEDISVCGQQVSESLGFEGTFNDGVIKHRVQDRERFELSVGVKGLLDLLHYAPPVFEAGFDVASQALYSIIDPRFFERAAGSLDLNDPRDLRLEAVAALDRTAVSRADTGFYMDRQIRLEEAWQVLRNNFPDQDTFLVGALRCDLRKILLLCERKLDVDTRNLVSESLRDTKRYTRGLNIAGTVDFIDELDAMLGDEIYFALAEPETFVVPDPDQPEKTDKNKVDFLPWPRVALLFELDKPSEFDKLVDWVKQIQAGIEDIRKVYRVTYSGEEFIEVEAPLLGIERLCFGRLEDVGKSYFLFTTSSEFYQKIIDVRSQGAAGGGLGVGASGKFRLADVLLEKKMASLVGSLDVAGLRRVLDGLSVEWAKGATLPDWTKIREDVTREVQDRYASKLTAEKIEAEVERRMLERDRVWRTEVIPAEAEQMRRRLDWLNLFQAVALRLRARKNTMSLALRVLTAAHPAE